MKTTAIVEGIALRDKILVSDAFKCSDILKELNVESREQAEKLGVWFRACNCDIFNGGEWKITPLQADMPEWYTYAFDGIERRVVDELLKWKGTHVHCGKEEVRVVGGTNHYIKDCKNVFVMKNAVVPLICGNSEVRLISEEATVYKICDTVKVNIVCDKATVCEIRDKANIHLVLDSVHIKSVTGEAHIDEINSCDIADSGVSFTAIVEEITGNATVDTISGAQVNVITGNATVGKIVGYSRIDSIGDSVKVDVIAGNAYVRFIGDDAVIETICRFAKITKISDNATVNKVTDYVKVSDCKKGLVKSVSGKAKVKFTK